ncbi:MAG: PucR family transcriptional regulator ligand-binding domain-containing protein [Oscillospiraceae bacterium]
MNKYTIGELLSSSNLSGIRLVSGMCKQDNVIENVNTIDNLDSYDWLKAGDFLLTTGFIFKDDPRQLVQMVEHLAKINCAGLGFKIMRYFDSPPPVMLRRAEELGLPIIEIPLKYSLADVSNEINNSLLTISDTQLTQYLRIHNSFNECSLTGGGIFGIISTLYGFVNNPVVLVDSHWRLLAQWDPQDELQSIALKPQQCVFPASFLNTLPENSICQSKIITRTYPDESGSLIVRIAPLADETSLYGHIMVFEARQQMDYSGFIALESATIPLVLERVKAKQLGEVKHQLRQDFFDDLLQGKIESVNAVSSLAEIHHMDIKNTYLCMVIKFQPNDLSSENSEERRNEFLRIKKSAISLIEDCSNKSAIETVSIHRSNLIISFVLVPSSKQSLHVWEIVGDFPQLVSSQLKEAFDIPFCIGIGTPIDDYLNIRKSYFQANEAIRYASSSENGAICYYENFMVDQLLDSVADRQALETFGQLSLGKLCDYDKAHGTNFLETLEVYFECNGNVSIAAKKLFLHRNSLIYRIDKIKDILNSDLKSATELLTLQVGIRVLKILRNK